MSAATSGPRAGAGLEEELERAAGAAAQRLAAARACVEPAAAWVDEARRTRPAQLEAEAREREQRAAEQARDRLRGLEDRLEDLLAAAAPGASGAPWDEEPPWGGGIETRALLPPLVRIGSLAVADGRKRPIPAMLPAVEHGSVLVRPAPGREHEGLALAQAMVARLITVAAPGALTLRLHDPEGYGSRLGPLAQIADRAPEALGDAGMSLDGEGLRALLLEVRDEIARRARASREFAAQRRAGGDPYVLLVLADVPRAFDRSALDLLLGIVRNGPQRGVLTIAVANEGTDASASRALRPEEQAADVALLDALAAHCATIEQDQEGRWSSTVDGARLTPDAAPREHLDVAVDLFVSRWADRHGTSTLAEAAGPPDSWGLASAVEGIVAGVGTADGGVPLELRFDDDVPGMMLAGTTGVGKSRLLHATICSFAARYSPDELELYLLDFKQGIEFMDYADVAWLPHARLVAAETEREFGLSVLRGLVDEYSQRMLAFRGLRKTSYGAARKAGLALPRILLIIDELKNFLDPQDDIAKDAAALLQTLAQQGRATGIHGLLASQTFGGLPELTRQMRAIRGLWKGRVAMQLPEDADVRDFLGQSSRVVQRLDKGQAAWTAGGGQDLVPFKVLNVHDDELHSLQEALHERFSAGREPPHRFVGGRLASIADCFPLQQAIARRDQPDDLHLWLGMPVEVGRGVEVLLPGHRLDHLAIVGRDPESAIGMLQATALAYAAQRPASEVVVIDLLRGRDRAAFGADAFAAALERVDARVRFVRSPEEALGVLAEVADKPPETGTLLLGLGLGSLASLAPDDIKRAAKSVQAVVDHGHRTGVLLAGWWSAFGTYEALVGKLALPSVRVTVALNKPEQTSVFKGVDYADVPDAAGPQRGYLLETSGGMVPHLLVPFGPITNDDLERLDAATTTTGGVDDAHR